MFISTDITTTLGFPLFSGTTEMRQNEEAKFEPLEKIPETTLPSDPGMSPDATLTGDQVIQKHFDPPVAPNLPIVSADSTPLQIWEGSVVEVDQKMHVMHVLLNAKIGQMPKHTGEIDLEWVSDQDQNLVKPGAVFYLTLFKRTKRGSIENAQELRFRRRPSWSAAQLKQIDEDASMLLSKMKALPTLE